MIITNESSVYLGGGSSSTSNVSNTNKPETNAEAAERIVSEHPGAVSVVRDLVELGVGAATGGIGTAIATGAIVAGHAVDAETDNSINKDMVESFLNWGDSIVEGVETEEADRADRNAASEASDAIDNVYNDAKPTVGEIINDIGNAIGRMFD